MTREELMQATLLALTRQNVVLAGGGGSDVVRNGLIIWYDGINNTGEGHSGDTAEWRDLSGHWNTGAIRNVTWGDDELICNGSSTWVNCGQQLFNAVTIEVLVKPDDPLPSGVWHVIAGNFQLGGYGFLLSSTHFMAQVYKNGAYRQLGVGPADTETYRHLGMSVDPHRQCTYVDGHLRDESVYDAQISPPGNGTVFGIGGNSNGSGPAGDYFKGRIKSFRFYNRVLTPEEIMQNYRYDKRRFGL